MNSSSIHINKKIVILGDFNPEYYTHLALNNVIPLLSKTTNDEISFEWEGTDTFDFQDDFFIKYSGLWIASGSPYKNMVNVLNTIRYARENSIPTFGNCGGFQHMLIEYARNVCGLLLADSEETNPDSSELLISKLSCSLVGEQEEISIQGPSLLQTIIEKNKLNGKYYCNYSLNPSFLPLLESFGMKMTAKNAEGEIRAFEIPDHPFYIGTLFQPALTSTGTELSPILTGFVKSVREVTITAQSRQRRSRDAGEE
ncbi:MAG: CTP synthase [Saprospiraceae bacterium]